MSEYDDEPVNFADAYVNWPSPDDDLTAVGNNPQTIFFFDWQRSRGSALHGRLMGYRKAATLLAEQVITRGRVDELDTVFFAYAFIWRHYIELQLKSLVVTYRILLDKEKKDELRHGLWPLWQQLHGLMKEAEDDVSDPSVKAAGKLLKQFHDLDPTSQEFRYDVRRNGSPTLEAVSKLDYISFHNGLDGLANFLEAIDDSVDHKLGLKREMRAEYDALMAEMYDLSYLAITQWAIAAERPPHLAAICPWEGFTDAYRDFARPGGLREDGFLPVWTTMLKALRRSPVTLRSEQKRRPLRDGWWAARDRDLEKIETPALVCGSFSDHCLHSRGSFEGFRRISSEHKWLYTHRGPKWATYYSSPARALQERFFGHFLRGEDNGFPDEPRVRLEVREDADTVTAVRGVADWPPPDTRRRDLHLDAARSTLDEDPVTAASQRAWSTRRGRVSFRRVLEVDTEVVGPMSVRLWVSLPRGGDVALVVGISKERAGRQIGFEGSYGFRGDVVTHGILKASHRRLAPEPGRVLSVPTHTVAEPLQPGEIVPVDVELLPSATLFRAGEVLRLDVQGRWLFPRNPLTGQFPAGYEHSPRGTCVLHTGGEHPSILRTPVRSPSADALEDE